MFLNLLFKAIKADPSEERMRAFIKRLLQVGSNIFQHFFVAFLSIVQYIGIFQHFAIFVVTFLTRWQRPSPANFSVAFSSSSLRF